MRVRQKVVVNQSVPKIVQIDPRAFWARCGHSNVAVSKGMSRIFHWGLTEARKAESGDGVFGEGQQSPVHQLGDLGQRCALPQRGSGTAQWFSTIFESPDGLSWHYNILLIIEGLREWTERLDIFLFFRPSLSGVLFPMFCLLLERGVSDISVLKYY